MILGAVWGKLNLMQQHHLGSTQAAWVVSMIFFGSIIGSPVVGWISDRLSLRKLPMFGFALASILLLTIIMYVPHLNYVSLMLLYLLLGFFTSSQVLSYPAISESNAPHYRGTAVGLASIIIMGGAALGQILFGWLLGLTHISHAHHVFSDADYTRAFLAILIGFIIAGFALLFAKETKGQPIYQSQEPQ
jgi:MFS family permease